MMQCCKLNYDFPASRVKISPSAGKTILARRSNFHVKGLLLYLSLVLSFQLCVEASKSCNRTREILSESWGTFSDGDDEYMAASHCEWLIKAPSSRHFITLKFSSLATECSYDHVYVYDGATFNSPLLGIFSGSNTPEPVTAKSGLMLVFLYSDTNYALNGFEAEYSITECHSNCSSNGVCVDHSCHCDTGYIGLGCDQPLCPEDCGSADGRGRCYEPPSTNADPKPQMFCLCNKGYFGDRCSMAHPVKSYNVKHQANLTEEATDRWHWLWGGSSVHSMSFSPRTSHASVYIEQLNKVFIFGGYDLNNILDDLVVYDVSNGTWLTIGDDYSVEALFRRLNSRRIASIVPHWTPYPIQKETGFEQLLPFEQYPPDFPLKSTSFEEINKNYVKSREPVALAESEPAVLHLSGNIHDVGSSSQIQNFSFPVENTESLSDKTFSAEISTEIERATERTEDVAIHRREHGFHVHKKKKRTRRRRSKRMVPPDIVTRRNYDNEAKPTARYGHVMAAYGKNFVLYGGKLDSGKLSSEFWMFDTSSETWSLLTNSSAIEEAKYLHPFEANDKENKLEPPALMYTTLTLVGEEEFYLFGGSLPHGAFSNLMFKINMSGVEDGRVPKWEKVNCRGGNLFKVRLVGHTTVYDVNSHSLIVYGGIRVDIARFSKLSDRLLKFDIANGYWSTISNFQSGYSSNPPLERAFHSAFVAGEYMVVFGGYLHKHKKEETCYDHHLHLYHLKCHTWHTDGFVSSLKHTEKGFPNTKGVYGHSSFLLNGRTVVILGGFHGTLSNALLAYNLPIEFVPDKSVTCSNYVTKESCVRGSSGEDGSLCGWCDENKWCYPHSSTSSCTSNLLTAHCPGICPLLNTCTSCTLSNCTWCPYKRVCQAFDASSCTLANDGAEKVQSLHDIGSMEGVSRSSECGSVSGVGLTYSLYRPPVDLTRPDVVSVNNGSFLELQAREEFRGAPTTPHTNDAILGKLQGFIIPPKGFPDRKLRLRAESLNASLSVEGHLMQQVTAGSHGRKIGEDVAFETLMTAYLVEVEGRSNGSLNLVWMVGDMVEKVTSRQVRVFRSGENCPARKNCLACVADNACGWCPIGKGFCMSNELPCSHPNGTSELDQFFKVLVPTDCPVCQQHIYCHTCTTDSNCEWLPDPAHCTRRGRFPSHSVTDSLQCPLECHERETCSDCLGREGRCAWCQHTQECFLFSVYTSVYQYGACRVWIDEDHTNITSTSSSYKQLSGPVQLVDGRPTPHPSASDCLRCNRHTNCDDCLHSLECGWCYNTHNPSIGVCLEGDYYTPLVGVCETYVNPLLDHYTNLSLHQLDYEDHEPSPVFDQNIRTTGYAYYECPDLDECTLKLHKCNPLATCSNTLGGYNCTCNRGYKGDGRTCERTCNVTCIHGNCNNNANYTCACDLGWTGVDCSVDCGCNNHSKCVERVGKCDSCQENTHGAHCELCSDDTWGSAVTPLGCTKCSCNEHGDPLRGTCHRETGQCFCRHNTMGRNCELCSPGFYGNPRNGGKCYRECEARNVIYEATSGNIGAQMSLPVTLQQHRASQGLSAIPRTVLTPYSNGTETCLWIVTPHSSVSPPLVKDIGSFVILFTVESLHISCSTSSLLVYDGLPALVSTYGGWDRSNHVLGSFCSEYSSESLPEMVEAKSGYLTILLQRRGSNEGFSGSYEVLSCPNSPGPNRVCLNNRPVCENGVVGGLCNISICPNNCNIALDQGYCDQTYGRCICDSKYVGEDCGTLRETYMVSIEELFDATKMKSSSQHHLLTVLPRFGHSMVSDYKGVLWLFGGNSLSRGALNDVIQFDTKKNTWVPVTVSVKPSIRPLPDRYFHSACYVASKRAMYIYGGLSDSSYLSDLWSFNVDEETWTLQDRPTVTGDQNTETHGNLKERHSKDPQDMPSGRVYQGKKIDEVHRELGKENMVDDGEIEFIVPPPLAGHTLTYCYVDNEEVLVLIGGISDYDGFLDNVWEYRLSTGLWSEVKTTGIAPLGVFGHSTVYHSDDQVFYVFGGYSFKIDRVGMFGELYALHYPSKKWSLIPPDNKINSNPKSLPASRAFHSAVSTNDYMLVIGGHIEEQRDLYQSLMVYSYKCNMWIPLNDDFIKQEGPRIPSLVGLSAAIHNRTVYVYGGYNGKARGSMMSIQVPYDLCSISSRENQCRDFFGCANCVVYGSVTNSSHCYSNARPKPSVCYGEEVSTNQGKFCNADLVHSDCYQYNTCGECLASYPAVPESGLKCKWCRSCPESKCIPKENDCASDSKCDGGGIAKAVTIADECYPKSCEATDCNKCEKLSQCIWNRQVLAVHSTHSSNITPIINWNCASKNIMKHATYETESSELSDSCPDRCMTHKTCSRCLNSRGLSTRWDECYWSQSLSSCLSPSYVPLRCLGGRCGVLLHTLPCPEPCTQHKTCSDCLKHPECGWCSMYTDIGGLGLCTDGGLTGPVLGTCSVYDFNHFVKNTTIATLYNLDSVEELPPLSWHYLECPAEDECRSGHHTCHPKSQECVDEPQGFSCHCAEGYNSTKDGLCVPTCQQGCVRGTCVEPNRCSCDFGYVGNNCSIECQCNGHSNCKGPDQLQECIECRNNTIGLRCSQCKSLFVGDPKNGGSCKSCFEYCNTHSSTCFPKVSNIIAEEEPTIGSRSNSEAVCQKCSNNTTGDLCEICLTGFFRGSTDLRKPCVPCECNGHSDVCDKVWGDDCKCSNNTESICTSKDSRITGKQDEKDCQKNQCSKCISTYLGSPSNGHQCYYKMSVEKEYCLDPENQSKCDGTPNSLTVGETVYFAVQPKFMNVNIRLILDITKGRVNVYFSARDDLFLVKLRKRKDAKLWRHKVEIDSKYTVRSEEDTIKFISNALNRKYIASAQSIHDIINAAAAVKKETPQCTLLFGCNNETHRKSRSGNLKIPKNSSEPVLYKLIEKKGNGLKTFATLGDPTDVLKVSNVSNRLVITLPQDGHDLRSAKFYLVIESIGDDTDGSAGYVFFRQDQPRIDLFVFFSVFFSCFFLFLALCVVVWKIKQNIDHRRARRRHVVEMLHMARRPFAVTTLVMQDSDDFPQLLHGHYSPSSSVAVDPSAATNITGACDTPSEPPPWSPGRRKRSTLNKKDSRGGAGDAVPSADSFEVGPVAVEPTDDGVAAVVTVVVQLPGFDDYDDGKSGENQSPSHRLSLGSSLCLMSRIYPAVSKPFMMKRRASNNAQ